MLAKRVIRPALRNPKNYRDLEAKPLKRQGFYSSRRAIAGHLTATTRDPRQPRGIPASMQLEYIKDVPEVTTNGMARIAQLFNKLDEKATQ